MNKLPAKYTGRYVALIDHKIVAHAITQLEVYKQAKKIDPHKLITLGTFRQKKKLLLFYEI